MTAISSVVQLADPALVWLPATGDADLVMIDDDIASDRGLETAVLLSLFTDRRAENDDRPPSGDARDRRGWWGDEFLVPDGDRYGSRLWLLDRSKRTNETVLLAKQYSAEALAWMLEDRVAAGVDVVVETTTSALLIAVTLHRPERDPITFRFNHVWDHVAEDSQ
jgi:phage gp46-like protein